MYLNRLLIALVLFSAILTPHTATGAQGPEAMPRVAASIPLEETPDWALLQRELFVMMEDAVEVFLDKYVLEDGRWRYPAFGNTLDDSFEPFFNWPMLYNLGGDEKLLEIGNRQFTAIAEQITERNLFGGMTGEFPNRDDWFHIGEGWQLFYNLCLADPNNDLNRERAKRFAELYFNEELGNFDSEKQMMRAPRNGAAGPAPWDPEKPPRRFFTIEHYGLPFYDIEGIEKFEDLQDTELYQKMAEAIHVRWSRGDGPNNLGSTALMLNAYLFTGDQRYADWIVDYTKAWMERAERNDGIIPDNIGLSGEIGEYLEGRWYGGHYGWTCYHGWGNIGQMVGIASQSSTLVTGDESYLGFIRSQIDMLVERAVEVGDTLYVPHKYGDPGKVINTPFPWVATLREDPNSIHQGAVKQIDGWFKFKPMSPAGVVHLWNMSTAEEDLQRIIRLRNNERRDHWGRNWNRVIPMNMKDNGGHEGAWLSYINGEYPDYPLDILKYNVGQVKAMVERAQKHEPDEQRWFNLIGNNGNPVTTEGLVQLTMGGPMPIFNGGLLMARLRHFDWQRKRPGLPIDVAALVSVLTDDRTVVTIVNIGAEEREMIVQAGAYGEHRFGEGRYYFDKDGAVEERNVAINGSHLFVQLPARSQITLDLETERLVNQPSYSLPW